MRFRVAAFLVAILGSDALFANDLSDEKWQWIGDSPNFACKTLAEAAPLTAKALVEDIGCKVKDSGNPNLLHVSCEHTNTGLQGYIFFQEKAVCTRFMEIMKEQRQGSSNK